CLLAPNGWQLLVAASLGDSAWCGQRPERGGLYVYDLRKLGGTGDSQSSSPLVAKYLSRPANYADKLSSTKTSCRTSREASRATSLALENKGQHMGSSAASRLIQGTGIGAIDLALAEEKGQTLALCLMDNVVRAFNLAESDGSMDPPAKPNSTWDFNVIESWEGQGSRPCSIMTSERYVFVSSTGPGLSVWRRPVVDQPYGHTDFRRPAMAPMEIRSRCVPVVQPDDIAEQVLVADPDLRPGESLSAVQAALERDRNRMYDAAEMRERLMQQRPSGPTPHAAMHGSNATWPLSIPEGLTA
ncbi:unnamed protein product, partial [Polarella glacialis]